MAWTRCITASLLIVLVVCQDSSGSRPWELDHYDPTWRTPSSTSAGSMPIGNGRTGLNVWVEGDGTLRFYISSTDSWSQNNVLMKLAGVSVAWNPTPFAAGVAFTQKLALRDGAIVITAGDEADPSATVRVWVDPHRDVVHVTGTTASPAEMTVSLDVWRKKTRPMTGTWRCWTLEGFDEPTPDLPAGKVITADVVLTRPGPVLTWYHRNEHSMWPVSMRLQGFGQYLDQFEDPLLHRTFGGAIAGDN
ncbi:DUF5703 domain-containing protein, partial [Candidatus Latescibacterota bacterium]